MRQGPIAGMDSDDIHRRVETAISVRGQGFPQGADGGFQVLDHNDGQAAPDRGAGTFQDLQLHPFDVNFQQIQARQT